MTLKGNREPFQLNNRISEIEIRLRVEKIEDDSLFTIHYGNFIIQMKAAKFYQVSEAVKGKYAIDIHFLLTRLLPDYQDFAASFLNKNETESALFKSVFLIWYWVEIAFTDAYASSLSTRIHDEFILDTTNLRSTQPDIYFLKLERITERTQCYIDRLVDLNLLVKVTFSESPVGDHIGYFIPLIKPGVIRTYFSHKNDPSGNDTYAFWKQVLEDRDARLRYWITNRF